MRTAPLSTTSRVALIAGAGRFPFHVAQEAKRQGYRVVVLGLRGWADPTLADAAQTYEELAVGELARLVERLKAHEVRHAIMAGKVTKDVLLRDRDTFDSTAQALIEQAGDTSVNRLLGNIAALLAGAGITVLDSSTFLREQLCPVGPVTRRAPSAAETADIEIGLRAARAIARLDIGQTVIVKRRVVVAMEGLEGTDAAIRRAHALAGDGLVVVKTASPSQDRRFDLPVIGLETIAVLASSGVTCMAVEAHSTLLLDREALVASANASGLCLIGVEPPAGS